MRPLRLYQIGKGKAVWIHGIALISNENLQRGMVARYRFVYEQEPDVDRNAYQRITVSGDGQTVKTDEGAIFSIVYDDGRQ